MQHRLMSIPFEQNTIRKRLARSRGVIGLLVLTPFALLTLLSPPPLEEGGWSDLSLDALGWCVFVCGAAFRWWATLYIGNQKDSIVVRDGPYSICRNPLYFGNFLLTLAIAAYLGSVTMAVGILLATVIYLSVTIPVEERALLSRFGSEYAEYVRVVPRWWPQFRRLNSVATLQLDVSGLRIEATRALRWMWIPVLCELITQLRHEGWWPQPFNVL
jgi:protein-S-isoprenylcysteine O-methyltransferase Ste14